LVDARLRLLPMNPPANDGGDGSYSGSDERDYIFQHAREEKTNLSSNTKQMVEFSVNNIAQYVKLIQLHNEHISIATYPHLPQIVPERTSTFRNGQGVDRKFNRIFEEQIQALCSRDNIAFKSFYDAISEAIQSGERLYFTGDMHFNEKGIEKLGNLVAAWINNSPEESMGTSFLSTN
jgi:lysophospholipase L1-like esterase